VERPFWSNEANQKVVDYVRGKILELSGCSALSWLPVHVIDLAEDGYITPHVDSIKFSGGLVCGVSLLSPAVMTLRPAPHEDSDHVVEKNDFDDSCVRLYLPPRSLYVLCGNARYDFTHSVDSGFGADSPRGSTSKKEVRMTIKDAKGALGEDYHRARRISLIFRDEKPAEV